MGGTARKFGLYGKIFGAERVDLFGTENYQLPDICEELGNAGRRSVC